MDKKYDYAFLPGILSCRHNPKGWRSLQDANPGDYNVCDKCEMIFDVRPNMGFDFSGIEVLWIDKKNNFKGSLQKKHSQADTNDLSFHIALKKFIEDGKIFLVPGLKIIYV